MKPASTFDIEGQEIGQDFPTYFIADIAANHDGDLERVKSLIYLAAEAGADAVKFQHFKAETIVSDHGFKNLSGQQSHQTKETCGKAGIAFFTSPYDKDLIDHVDPYLPAYQIGSGDITWIEMIEYIASK